MISFKKRKNECRGTRNTYKQPNQPVDNKEDNEEEHQSKKLNEKEKLFATLSQSQDETFTLDSTHQTSEYFL